MELWILNFKFKFPALKMTQKEFYYPITFYFLITIYRISVYKNDHSDTNACFRRRAWKGRTGKWHLCHSLSNENLKYKQDNSQPTYIQLYFHFKNIVSRFTCYIYICKEIVDFSKSISVHTKREDRTNTSSRQSPNEIDTAIVMLYKNAKVKVPLPHSLELSAGGIGLHVNSEKTEYMCFNQKGDFSILNGGVSEINGQVHLLRKQRLIYWKWHQYVTS